MLWVPSGALPQIRGYAESELEKPRVIREARAGASFSVARVVVMFGGNMMEVGVSKDTVSIENKW